MADQIGAADVIIRKTEAGDDQSGVWFPQGCLQRREHIEIRAFERLLVLGRARIDQDWTTIFAGVIDATDNNLIGPSSPIH